MLLAAVRPFPLLPAASGRRSRPARPRLMSVPEDSADRETQARDQAGLLAAMSRGDKPALAKLYDTLGKPLYSLAFRVTNDAAEAQDIVQDVFLQLWHKAGSYDPARGSVFGWAATLTRNRAIDRVRMRKRRAELLAGSAAELQPAAPAGESDSAGALWVQEKAGAVRAALTQLAPDQQKALELAYYSGLTQQEIATKLNEPLGTIKARIRRGLLKLRATLPDRL
jgi:RNA polymerase sigma-70 factor, ECF subfamily